jgi:hypothetical protein
MAQDLEQILRKTLDEADHYRKRWIMGSAVLAGIVMAGLGFLDHLRATGGDVRRMVFFAVAVLLTGQVTVAVVTWSVVAAMGRRLLKAIELISEK